MRTKQHWTLRGEDKDRMRTFFCQLWRLVSSFGCPPGSGSDDDDAFWDCLVMAVSEIGQRCDADHNPWAARFLIAVMEAAGNVQRLQDPGGGADRPDRPGGPMEDAAAS